MFYPSFYHSFVEVQLSEADFEKRPSTTWPRIQFSEYVEAKSEHSIVNLIVKPISRNGAYGHRFKLLYNATMNGISAIYVAALRSAGGL